MPKEIPFFKMVVAGQGGVITITRQTPDHPMVRIQTTARDIECRFEDAQTVLQMLQTPETEKQQGN